MPAARRRSGTMPDVVSMTPLRTPHRTRSAATPGTRVDVDDSCCVCFDDITAKRTSILHPCLHNYHTSCVRNWMETREERAMQRCPLCRTRTSAVKDHCGDSAPPSFPFGASGEPTKDSLRRYDQPANLQWLLSETESNLARCALWFAKATNEDRGVEYIEDIKSEETKLEARKIVLQRMLQEVGRGEWEEEQRPAITMQELHARLERLRQLQQEYLLRMAEGRRGGATPTTQPQFAFPANQHDAARAASAVQVQQPQRRPPAARQDWTQARPLTVPIPFFAGRHTLASRARMRNAEEAAAAAAAPPPHRAAATPVRRMRPPVRVPAAGPAARRRSRLSGLSSPLTARRATTAAAAAHGAQRAEPAATSPLPVFEATPTRAAEDDGVREHEEGEEEEMPNYHVTPRRSSRIAAMRMRAATMPVPQVADEDESPVIDLRGFEEGVTSRSTPRSLAL